MGVSCDAVQRGASSLWIDARLKATSSVSLVVSFFLLRVEGSGGGRSRLPSMHRVFRGAGVRKGGGVEQGGCPGLRQ